MLVQTFDFEGKDVKTTFEVRDASFERFVAGASGLLKQRVDGDTGHLGDAANTAGKTEFTKFFIFLRREAEADHAVSGFKRHWLGWAGELPTEDATDAVTSERTCYRRLGPNRAVGLMGWGKR